MSSSKTIGAYISRFPKSTQRLLNQMRSTIRRAAPKAQEAIKYGMPTYVLGRNLVHFAGYKNHIGFYPGALATQTFKKHFARYKSSKGAIQFPIDQKLPLALVTRITKFRVRQEQLRALKTRKSK